MAINQRKAGAVLSYATLGLSNIVGLLYTPYMLRIMGQSEFGLFSLVSSVVSYLTILDFGFGNATVRYVAKFKAEGKTKELHSLFGMFIVIYSILGLIAFLGGMVLYLNINTFFGNSMTPIELDKARIMMLLMVFNVSVSFPLGVFGAIMVAYEVFIFQKTVGVIRIILSPIVLVIVLSMGYRAVAMVIIITAFNIITLLINTWYCFYRLRIRIVFRKFNGLFAREIAGYSFFIFLNMIMDKIYWSAGQLILGALLGTAAVAIYAVAIQLKGYYMALSTSIVGVLFPKVIAMVANNRMDKEISDLFIRVGRLQYIIMAFILSGFILFGKQFIIIWAGAGYEKTYYIALLFMVPLTVPLIQNLGISILQARNQQKFRSYLYVSISILSLLISIPLAKLYGGIGCAVGTSLALIIGQIVSMNIYYHRRIGLDIPRFWREIIKMSPIPVLLVIIFGWLLHFIPVNTVMELGFAITVFSLVYIPLFWFLGMNQYERTLIGEPVQRIYYKLKVK